MITGCNTNVRHAGRLFHVQTEDSGRANPHIISHVYHGGTILASEKSEYGDGQDVSDDDVRALIEEQHGAMLARLKEGKFDEVIAERLGAAEPDPAALGNAVTNPDPAPDPDGADATGSSAAASTGPMAGGATTAGLRGGATTDPAVDDEPPPAKPPAPAPSEPAFGDTGDAQKPLDEVILEYLVKKARDRSGDRGASARQSRRKE